MGTEIEIRHLRETDLESFREGVNSVCHEKWYVATVDGFTLEQIQTLFKRMVEDSAPQIVAVDDSRIVGWCNIIPNAKTGFTHVGYLGMGVIKSYRRQGIGRRLVEACLALARSSGLEKVELEVFADNEAAIRLYESLGFRPEGLKIRARKIEGKYQDIQRMALMLEGSDTEKQHDF